MLCFCDAICQKFFVMWFFHFTNVSCLICKNKYFVWQLDWSYIILKLVLEIKVYSSKLYVGNPFLENIFIFHYNLCWGGNLHALKPWLKVLSASFSKNSDFCHICLISSSSLSIKIFTKSFFNDTGIFKWEQFLPQ